MYLSSGMFRWKEITCCKGSLIVEVSTSKKADGTDVCIIAKGKYEIMRVLHCKESYWPFLSDGNGRCSRLMTAALVVRPVDRWTVQKDLGHQVRRLQAVRMRNGPRVQ
jgi:hypothetical protein